jgi:hypothetical protein
VVIGIVERQRIDVVAFQHAPRIAAEPADGALEPSQIPGLKLALAGNPVESTIHIEDEGILESQCLSSRRRLFEGTGPSYPAFAARSKRLLF